MTSTDATLTVPFQLYASESGEPELAPNATQRTQVLASVPTLARKLTGADYAALTVIGRSGHIEQMFISGMSQAEADKIGHPPIGKGVLGLMMPHGDILLVKDRVEHPKSSGYPGTHPEMKAVLGVAVEDDGRHAANLYLANRPGNGAFTDEDSTAVESVAKLAATALENARLYEGEANARRMADDSRSWLQAVITEARVGILVIDSADGSILLSSPEASRIAGVPLESGMNQAPIKCFAPTGLEIPYEKLPLSETRVSGQTSGPLEVVCQRPDGKRIPLLISAAPLPAGGTRGGAVIAVLQDVTRLKELDEVKRDFLSMITHDLRSPLATIKGLITELVPSLDGESELNSDIEAIDEEIDQTIELVSNLLDMSRIEAGAYPLDMEITHMIDMSEDAIARARRSRVGMNRDVQADVPANLPPLFADPAQLGRVLDNLLSNALKYSEGKVTLCSEVSEDGDAVRTFVIDSGIGIPVGDSDLVFDKFFRVTGGPRAGRGAGLGLAICKAIVNAHGGEVGVNSTLGDGSEFWFTMPVYKQINSVQN